MNEIIEALRHLKEAFGFGKLAVDLWKSVQGSQATPEQEAAIRPVAAIETAAARCRVATGCL